MYFLRGVLLTPAEFRIFSDSTVPVNITISHFSVKNNRLSCHDVILIHVLFFVQIMELKKKKKNLCVVFRFDSVA